MGHVPIFFSINSKCLLIIITYNQLEYTRQCIESIQSHTDYPHRVLIIDNCSNQETVDYLQTLKNQEDIEVIFNKENQGWIGGVNQGLAFGDYVYYCVMNNDIVVYPGWLSEMVKMAEQEERIGLVNPEWDAPKKYRQDYQRFFQEEIIPQRNQSVETDWMRGFCFLIKRSVVRAIGGLDTIFGAGYYDDWDYSMRAIKAGFRCVRAKGAFVYHCKNITFNSLLRKFEYDENFNRNKALFYNRWGRPLRVLVIYSEDLNAKKDLVRHILRSLLENQDNVFLIQTGDESLVEHTNCVQKKVSASALIWNIWGRLMDNLRHALRKRYNIILCSQEVKHRITQIPLLTNQYRLLTFDTGSEEQLLGQIRGVKQYK